LSLPADIEVACFGHRARMTARALTRLFNARLQPLGLQITQFGLLVTISSGRHGSVAAMADRLDVEPSALLRNLKLLEARGLLTSEGGRGRNGRRLHLTEAGRALLERAAPLWAEVHAELASALGADETDTRAALARLEAAAVSVAKERS
jgi:DNA-binding MarR family transcriptional regulator